MLSDFCPFCYSKDFVKRGVRQRKHSVAQLYLCKNPECGKTFTAEAVKGKHFPFETIIEGLNFYNLGYTLEETKKILKFKFGAAPETATLSNWVREYEKLCTYSRLRPYATKLCKPKDTIETVTMAHRQLYRFRYHRPKLHLLITEHYKHRQFGALEAYLNAVSAETPHQYFQDGIRMSEVKSKFDKAEMIVRSKHNYANELAKFVLQAVKNNKDRHEAVQRFMIANDSVTVATEVPVYIRREDIEHMQNVLDFKILDAENPEIELKGKKKIKEVPKLLTGHIDVVQVRNGLCHILDYKPNAAKEHPIEQLTWYALALSRLTGLRLYEFKCAWFDEKDYFEFYPLHVVKKLKHKRDKKIIFKDGTTAKTSKENILKII